MANNVYFSGASSRASKGIQVAGPNPKDGARMFWRLFQDLILKYADPTTDIITIKGVTGEKTSAAMLLMLNQVSSELNNGISQMAGFVGKADEFLKSVQTKLF